MKQDITTFRIRKRQNRAQRPAFAFQEPLCAGFSAGSPVLNEVVLGTRVNKSMKKGQSLLPGYAPVLTGHAATETSGGKEAEGKHEMSERTPRRQLVGQRGEVHADRGLPSCPEEFCDLRASCSAFRPMISPFS